MTVDDSWAAEQVEAGEMTEEDAEANPQAHAITRWLGADAPESAPNIAHYELSESGRLVVCSDGLWNYCSDASMLATELERLPADVRPIDAARHLTAFALEAGGHDNITVVVLEVSVPS